MRHYVGERPGPPRPAGRGAAVAAACGALFLLLGHVPARAADLGDFRSPLGWDGRVIQPDGLYAVTVPRSWTVARLDENSFHGSAPGEESFFIYMTVAKKRFNSPDAILGALVEHAKKELREFKEVSRQAFTQDGHKGKTLQAEENDGAWSKVFYMVVLTDTHQYLLRTGCRLDRFSAVQPVMKEILGSLYVGGYRDWNRKNTHAIEDPHGRYSAAVPPGWRVDRRQQRMKAEDPGGRLAISLTIRKRTHGSLKEYSAALAETLKKQYPGQRIGSPQRLPQVAASNRAARSVRIVTGGPSEDTWAHVYGIALNERHEFLLQGIASGMQGTGRNPAAATIGSLVGLWHVHLRPE